MKPVIIIAIAFVLLIPVNAYADSHNIPPEWSLLGEGIFDSEFFFDIVSTIGVIVAMGLVAFTVNKSKKQSVIDTRKKSAEIVITYNDRFLQDRFRFVSRAIDYSTKRKEKIKLITTGDTNAEILEVRELDLENYLSEFETIGLFVEDGILLTKHAYEMWSEQIQDIWKDVVVFGYMDNQHKGSDMWDKLYDLKDKLDDFAKEKANPKKGWLKSHF